MGAAAEVDKDSFDQEVLKSEVPVLVDFWAPWCGPCKAIAPTVDALAEELDGKLKVVKVNTDVAGDIAVRFEVMTIPTLLVFKGGEMVERLVGNQPKGAIQKKLEAHMA
jgi:thioredoxin 1